MKFIVLASLSVLVGSSVAIAKMAETAPQFSWQQLKDMMVKSAGTKDAIVFATASRSSHGVLIDGDNPLGEVTPIQGTPDVSFRPCHSEEAEIVPARSVLPTTEVCTSLPGFSPPSLQARHWIYHPDLDGFKVAFADTAQEPASSAFVSCKDIPSALIIVASKTREGEETVAGSPEALANLGVESGKRTEIPDQALSTPSLCREASEFWTFDASAKELAGDHAIQILGVSRKQPGVM